MNVIYSSNLKKDIQKIKNKKLSEQLKTIIIELKNADSIKQIKNMKVIKDHKGYYRIKIGNYRLGLRIDNNDLVLLRFLPRKDIYKYFPKK